MDFSVWPSFDRSWDEVLSTARWAEEHGLAGLWFADHYMSQTPDDSASDAPTLECWTALTGIAALVPRLRLTSMESPLTIHHPVVLATRVATLDQIAPGRAVLGIGAGWQVNEHTAYGFELPAPGERVSRFAEGIEVIHQLLHEQRGTVDGRWYQLVDAPFAPKPAHLPVLVGTGSPRMMRITARFADVWNTWGDPTQLRERNEMWLAACAAEGRDPATVKRSAQAMIFLTDDDAKRDKLRAKAPAGRSLVGGSNELVDMLATYVEAGVDEFALLDATLGGTPEARRDVLDRLHAEVLSAFM